MDNGLEIFVAASVDYAELNSVKYQADQGQIMLETAIDDDLTEAELLELVVMINCGLKLHYQLSNQEPRIYQIQSLKQEHLCFLRLYRDVDTISLNEIQLFIDLLKEKLGAKLMADIEPLGKDSFKMQIKKKLLLRMSGQDNSHQYFAYREDGRVRVFNR